MKSLPDDRHPVEELADEFVARLRQGECPSLTEYVTRFPGLAAEIRETFPAIVALEGLRSEATASQTAAIDAAPVRLGEYRILREIGRGGMGVVYEAVQDSLSRRVAIKVLAGLKSGDGAARQRFRREAQAVARLHHTNIVQTFGVGEENGVAYYAMQYIEGEPLDAVLDAIRFLTTDAQLTAPREVPRYDTSRSIADTVPADIAATAQDSASARARHLALTLVGGRSEAVQDVEYFRRIARLGMHISDAVAYAHRAGVLHRDIKPSNLLLDTSGAIWVTDFGLAKACGTDHVTATGDVLGTLRYLPPERLKGASLPQGDVYSLGVTLYEMLTLRPAIDVRDRARIVDVLAHGSVPPPSRVVPGIPRDLDTIVQKATAKDPRDRYAGADELAAELRRFLDNEPIHARQLGLGEQFLRWSSNNRPIVALVATVLTLLSALAAGTSYSALRIAASRAREAEARQQAQQNAAAEAEQRRVAERSRVESEESYQHAKAAVDEFFTLVSENKLLDAPGEQALRRELLQSALRYYRRFSARRINDPALQSDHALTLMRVGVLNSELGDTAAAFAALTHAAQMQAALVHAEPGEPEPRRRLAETYLRLGELHRRPRLEMQESLQYFQKSLEIFSALAAAEQASAPRLHDLALVRWHLATLLEDIGRLPQAADEAQNAVTLTQQALRTEPDKADFQLTLGRALFRRSSIANRQGDFARSLPIARESTEIFRHLVAAAPQVIVYQKELAVACGQFAMTLYSSGDQAGAAEPLAESLRLLTKVAAENPQVTEYQVLLTQAQGLSAIAEYLAGRLAPAAQNMRDATAGARTLAERMPDDPFLRITLIYLYEALSVTRPDFSLPQETYEEGIQILSKILRLPPGNSDFWATRATCHARLGHWHEAAADLDLALQTAKRDWTDLMRLALLRYRVDDVEGYRTACRELLDRVQNEDQQVTAFLMFPVMLIGAQSVDDYQPLFALAEQPQVAPSRSLLLGCLEYRAGRPAAALDHLESARQSLKVWSFVPLSSPVDSLLNQACNEFMLWCVYRDVHEPDLAADAHRRAVQFLSQADSLIEHGRSQLKAVPWEIKVFAECLRRELDPPPPEVPG